MLQVPGFGCVAFFFLATTHTQVWSEYSLGAECKEVSMQFRSRRRGSQRWADMYTLNYREHPFSDSVQTLSDCDPMDCSMPGLPVHHQLPELAQTHVHPVRDAIQLSHPLSSPSPPAFSLSQHQGLFQGVSCLNHVAKVLVFQLQHQSFQ